MDKIINGKKIADHYKQEIKETINKLNKKLKLVVIQVGDNPASNVYIKKKQELCEEMNINFALQKYSTISEENLIAEINKLNNLKEVTSILVQLPLPDNINPNKIIEAIDPKKDVDGLTSANLGKLFAKEQAIVPCTALGVVKLLEYQNLDLNGKKIVIVGRSKLVGLPLIALLLNKNATVTVCHSKTKNLEDETKRADILIVAIGKKEFITKEMIKKDAIIIDVGINRCNNKLYGDVAFDNVYEKCSLITPVPKGVGPMTVIMLINNIIECYNIQTKN